jgi:N-methylhydantoinase A
VTAGVRAGVDVGGTFTDLVAYDEGSGALHVGKVPTVTGEPARGVAGGLAGLERAAGAVTSVAHGTTVITNAIVERRVAAVGLVTTRGFRDVLEIARMSRTHLYRLDLPAKPEPLVPRHLRREIGERVGPDGTVLVPLDLGGVDELVAAFKGEGVEAVAVALLHAYANPAHERALREALAPHFAHLCVSSDINAEFREYERTATTVLNASVMPLAAWYLDGLAATLGRRLHLLHSAGGMMSVAAAKARPLAMAMSGPAAGVAAAAFVARSLGLDRALAFDMGGTTTDVCLVADGVAQTSSERRLGGHPVRLPMVAVESIGAGGGSIARVDEIGLLKVGPESAGSFPGPAAYGLGGREATVTDADFLLGYLNPDYFAGGEVTVDLPAARAAVERLAARVHLTPAEVAWGIHDVVNENMAGAARVHVAERGRDPRGYALLCTGGAGPVHAYYVAKKLGLARVICPPSAGVASALGLLVAPARVDRVATVGLRLDRDDVRALEAAFARLEAEARAVLADTGLPLEGATVRRLADGRFLGQGFDRVVALPDGPYDGGEATRRALAAAFEAAYREKFSLTPPDVPVEFLNVRVAVRAPVAGADVVVKGAPLRGAGDAVKGTRPAYFPEAGGFVPTTVYDRYRLGAGDELAGPAVIEEEGSTLVVGPGGRARVAASGNVVVTLPSGRPEAPA